MTPIPNPRILFTARPVGYPNPDTDLKYDTSQSIDLEGILLNGGLLAKTLYVGIGPYLRNRMKLV